MDGYPDIAPASKIRLGDEFFYRGIPGEAERTHRPDVMTEIRIVGSTMWGDLLVLERWDGDTTFKGKGYKDHTRSVRFADALLLIEQGVWIARNGQAQAAAEDDDKTIEALVEVANVLAEYNQERGKSGDHAVAALDRISAIIDAAVPED